jgi:signal transduction histidine kinase/streptogramin lyase
VDRHDALWVGTESEGLYRIFDGLADHYASVNGLSGDTVNSIYEDREGNLWVATDKGTDLFRDTPVLTFSTSEGVVGSDIRSVSALKNGSVWVGNSQALNVIKAGRVSAIGESQGLPGHDASAVFEDSTGLVWIGIDDTLMTYTGDRYFDVKDSDGGPLRHTGVPVGFAEDVDGDIWALTYLEQPSKFRLFRLRGQAVQESIFVDDKMQSARRIVADRESGIWIGSSDGNLLRYRKGESEVFSLGTPENPISARDMFVDKDNSIWSATSRGLYRWQDGKVTTMDTRNGLPDCFPFYYAIKDNDGSLWIYAACGVIKIPAADLARWLAEPEAQVSVRTFGPLEGAFPSYSDSPGNPKVAKSSDGRLWFAGLQIIQMIDPGRSYLNAIPPPVHVEALIADRKTYTPGAVLDLPALTRDLEIDYTALSFTVPQQVRFRYKLDGHDADWQDAGTRRQAFYSDLPPGEYLFNVMAANNDGVWNETGASLAFSIAPAWYQSGLFRILLVVILLVVVWLLYRLRVAQISHRLNAGFNERLAERTRVARELHDTFLQTVQGSKMVADHALTNPADHTRMVRAMEQLSAWLEQATREGREALNSLRASATERNDLAEALRRATESCVVDGSTTPTFSVAGESRDMHPIVRDEIYRIGYEAIRNACAHSGASRIEVELRYDKDLVVSVTDNGKGIDPVTAADGKEGHFGLKGMRERAGRIGAKLTLDTSLDAGTEVTLMVPGDVAYRSSMPQE